MLSLDDSDQIPEPPPGDSESDNSPSQTNGILNLYQSLTRSENPLRWAAINRTHSSTLTNPTYLVSGTWDRNDIFSFRHALITITALWKPIATDSGDCLTSFTNDELELHDEEMEVREDLGTLLHLLQDQNPISVGGEVLRDYERAQTVNERAKKMLLDMGEGDGHKDWCEKLWPY